MDVCAERGLFLASMFFKHKMIHRYTWRRREDGREEKSLIDYIAVDERLGPVQMRGNCPPGKHCYQISYCFNCLDDGSEDDVRSGRTTGKSSKCPCLWARQCLLV